MISSAAAPSFSGELLPAVTVPMPGMKAGLSAASASHAAIGPDALIDGRPGCGRPLRRAPRPARFRAWNSPAALRAGRQLVAAQGEGVLLLARDALRLGQELGRDAHHQRAFAGAAEQLGVQVDVLVHRDVLHVLQAADDLHVFEAGHDRVRGLVDGLQAGAAQPVDRRAAGVPSAGRPSAPTLRATLKPCSPCCCVLPSTTSSISPGSMPVRSTSALTTAAARSSERTWRKTPFSLWARPIGRAKAIDDDGMFHGSLYRRSEFRRSWNSIDCSYHYDIATERVSPTWLVTTLSSLILYAASRKSLACWRPFRAACGVG